MRNIALGAIASAVVGAGLGVSEADAGGWCDRGRAVYGYAAPVYGYGPPAYAFPAARPYGHYPGYGFQSAPQVVVIAPPAAPLGGYGYGYTPEVAFAYGYAPRRGGFLGIGW